VCSTLRKQAFIQHSRVCTLLACLFGSASAILTGHTPQAAAGMPCGCSGHAAPACHCPVLTPLTPLLLLPPCAGFDPLSLGVDAGKLAW
jgi:hypothetical protein